MNNPTREEQAKMLSSMGRLTFLEKFPTQVAGVGVGVRHRLAKTGSALRRGRELAVFVKEEMNAQAALIEEAEDLQGNVRCVAYANRALNATNDLRNKVQGLRALAGEVTLDNLRNTSEKG